MRFVAGIRGGGRGVSSMRSVGGGASGVVDGSWGS